MSYADISSHRYMVYDDVRNQFYSKAIKQYVTPDSVVLDLGAGLGIHGLLAAATGAKQVYLVDPEPVVNIAMKVAQANGLADRVTVLEGRIEDVDLPEKVDIIVSVLAGNLLFSEDLLSSLYYARDHYLRPEGKLIPDMAELMVAPVSAGKIYAETIEQWHRQVHGLDYSSVKPFAANEIQWLQRKELDLELLAQAQAITTIDFEADTKTDCMGEAQFTIDRLMECHGLAGWIRLRFADEWLDTGPKSSDVHWMPAMLPFEESLALDKDEVLDVKLQRPAHGDWSWTVETGSGRRKQSTFLSRFNSPWQLQAIAPENRTQLNTKGQAMLTVLQMMQDGKTIQQIAQHIKDSQPDCYRSIEEALQHVQKTVMRYVDNRQ